MLWQDQFVNWLVHSAVFGTIILAIGYLAVRFCREPIYRVQIIHWTFAACLLVPLLQSLAWTPGFSLNWWRTDGGSNRQTAISNRDTELSGTTAPSIAIDTSDAPPQVVAAQIETVSIDSQSESASHDRDELAEFTESPARRTIVDINYRTIAIQVLSIVYVAIVGYWLILTAIGFVRRRSIARHAVPACESLREVLITVAGSQAQRVRLLVSQDVNTPVMWGLWRPTIVIPAAMAATPNSAELCWALAHEWSHVRCGDFGTLLLSNVAKFACFYQPAFWRLRRLLMLSQDYLADAFASQQGGSCEDYADFLVSLARSRQRPQLAGALGIVDRGSNLFQRVKMLVESAQPLSLQSRRLPAACIVVIALVAVCGLGAVRLNAEPKNEVSDQTPVAAPQPAKVVDNQPQQLNAPVAKEPADKEEAERPGSITYAGKVIDRDTRKPIADATVEVIHELSRHPKTGEHTALQTTTHRTDADGNYRFTLPPEEAMQPSLYIVVDAHHPKYQSKGRSGYSHAMIRKNLANGDPPFYSLIELSAGEPISGVVLRPDGKPAANLRVLAYSKPPSKEPGRSFDRGAFQDAQTDDAGRFQVVVATPGDGVLWVFPKDYSPIALRIGDRRGDVGTLQLDEGTRLSGQVLDAKGNPVPHVGVNIRRRGDGEKADEFLNNNAVANQIGSGAESDEAGRFQFNPLPPGPYRIEVKDRIDDPTIRRERNTPKLKLDHVFSPLEVVIQDGVPNDPIEIRATPHVIVRGRFFDGQGQPRESHEQSLFGKFNGTFFFARSTLPGKDGWFEFKVPHGIEEVEIDLSTNEHSSLRWRLKSDDPLVYGDRPQLGTLEQDFTTFEVVRYVAPMVLVKAVDENGAQIVDYTPSSKYTIRPEDEKDGTFISGALGDVNFNKQTDGRWRSEQLLPDQETSITLVKDGYTTEPQVVSLKERDHRELVFVMKKSD